MQSSILTTSSQIADVLSFIEGHTEFAFDTETDGLSWDRRWIGFSFAVKIGDEYTGWYVPLYHEKVMTFSLLCRVMHLLRTLTS